MPAKLSSQTRLIAIVGLAAVIAFVGLMVVRTGILGSSSNSSTTGTVAPAVPQPSSSSKPAKAASHPARPKVVLLPNLPTQIASKLRNSKVVVVSIYLGPVAADRAFVAQAMKGSRASGAGFTAINVANDKNATTMNAFVGPVSSPTTLVVRRPGKIVAQFPGLVDAAVVTQAAHNAGARRR
jgi:hypothetical protein